MYLPSEWHTQAFVQLTWPHKDSDWDDCLDEVLETYYNMAREIIKREPLLIVAQNVEEAKSQLATGLDGRISEGNRIPEESLNDRVSYFECPTNDTWARDHAFITCLYDDEEEKEGIRAVCLDYCFNGWGLKFPSNHDNQINKLLYESGRLDAMYINLRDFVLEGGSIESDGNGTLLTTESCLLAPNRNEVYDKPAIERRLRNDMRARRVLWLQHGHLEGDDTDGHIDTIARFCSEDTIAYTECTDMNDAHYEEFLMMEQELKAFRTIKGQPYKLVPLPLPDPIYDESGERLPATYANFLIVNGAVLYPTYSQPMKDLIAHDQLVKAFPGREIVGIDCRVLIRQHGSLHCCTMQYPSTKPNN